MLPLHDTGRIANENALRKNWLEVCPAITCSSIEVDLGGPTGRLALETDAAVETYLCGNPPYKGSQGQSQEQKLDLQLAFDGTAVPSGAADYVLGWFAKGRRYLEAVSASFAFVATNSIHQGRQVGRFWPYLLGEDLEIQFAEPSFRWHNLASRKAAVTVSVIGIGRKGRYAKRFYQAGLMRQVDLIGPYLVPNHVVVVTERGTPLSLLPAMTFGSMPNDGGYLLLNFDDAQDAVSTKGVDRNVVRQILGTNELAKGIQRYCLWLNDLSIDEINANPWLTPIIHDAI